jgi:hypothetical protein
MLTLKLFDSLLSIKNHSNDSELRNWANIEYKKDADFAYHHIKEHGVAPRLENNR